MTGAWLHAWNPDKAGPLQSGGGGGVIRKGGGGVWFVYQTWPDKIFPIVNFVFSHDGHFLKGGGGSREGTPSVYFPGGAYSPFGTREGMTGGRLQRHTHIVHTLPPYD